MMNNDFDANVRLSLASVKRARAAAAEPQISDALLDIVCAKHNAKLDRFNHRLKSVDSLARKIKSDAVAKRVSYAKAAREIRDVVRYTAVLDDNNYWDEGDAILADLQTRGFRVTKNPQRWDCNGGYKGRNAALIAAPSGVEFELQLHTPASLRVSSENHTRYEELRELSTSEQRKQELRDEMKAAFSSVPLPPGTRCIHNTL